MGINASQTRNAGRALLYPSLGAGAKRIFSHGRAETLQYCSAALASGFGLAKLYATYNAA
jgi:hypothetical protein